MKNFHNVVPSVSYIGKNENVCSKQLMVTLSKLFVTDSSTCW